MRGFSAQPCQLYLEGWCTAKHVHRSLKSRSSHKALCIADNNAGGDQSRRQSMQADGEDYGQQGCPEGLQWLRIGGFIQSN